MASDMHRWTIALFIAGLASLRYLLIASWRVVGLSAFLLAVVACLQKVGALRVPVLGPYLEKVPVEASVTLIGILLASVSAVQAWRSQKRDELLLASLYEVQDFFERVFGLLLKMNVHVRLVRDLQIEVLKGPYNLDSYWGAKYLSGQSQAMHEVLSSIHELAVEVHSLDGRNVHAMTSKAGVFRAFKMAKKLLDQLDDAAYISLPSYSEDPHQYISDLRLIPSAEYDTFLRVFKELHSQAGGAVGGIRGAIQAKFFPPTFTLARALLRLHKDA